MDQELVIAQTKRWIREIVIGLNFCPFANQEFKNDTIKYLVTETKDMSLAMQFLIRECVYLDQHEETATTLIIFSEGFRDFDEYLYLVNLCEKLIRKQRYEGIYQVASFHPDYTFEGEDPDDPANYTNRSIYPMLHILREEQLENALDKFPDPDAIPGKNIALARRKGLKQMQALRAACL